MVQKARVCAHFLYYHFKNVRLWEIVDFAALVETGSHLSSIYFHHRNKYHTLQLLEHVVCMKYIKTFPRYTCVILKDNINGIRFFEYCHVVEFRF